MNLRYRLEATNKDVITIRLIKGREMRRIVYGEIDLGRRSLELEPCFVKLMRKGTGYQLLNYSPNPEPEIFQLLTLLPFLKTLKLNLTELYLRNIHLEYLILEGSLRLTKSSSGSFLTKLSPLNLSLGIINSEGSSEESQRTKLSSEVLLIYLNSELNSLVLSDSLDQVVVNGRLKSSSSISVSFILSESYQ